jgi:hypothetical protein
MTIAGDLKVRECGKVYFCLNKHHIIKTRGRVEVELHILLAPTLDERLMYSFTPRPSYILKATSIH